MASGTDAGQVPDLVRFAVSVKPAPPPLDVIQRLVNTRNSLNDYDLLEDLPAARAWLAVAHPGSRQRLLESDLDRLRELRETLRALLLAHARAEVPAPDVLARLRSFGTASRLSVDFDAQGTPQLSTVNTDDVVESNADAAFAAMASVQPEQLRRLKACINPACGWAFYDTSRSRNGTWCVMEVCGARHKMARYRHRSRQTTNG